MMFWNISRSRLMMSRFFEPTGLALRNCARAEAALSAVSPLSFCSVLAYSYCTLMFNYYIFVVMGNITDRIAEYRYELGLTAVAAVLAASLRYQSLQNR